MSVTITEVKNSVSIAGQGVKGEKGDGFKVDAVGLFSELSDYDDELASFTFLASDTGNLYIKNTNTSGDWSDAIPFKGDKGEKGDDGADGKTILNGAGAPAISLGVDGDFYIDTTADAIYGPKISGAWGTATLLNGEDGSVWYFGTGTPDNGAGVDGDYYLQSNGNIWNKQNSAWVFTGINITGPTGTTDHNALTNLQNAGVGVTNGHIDATKPIATPSMTTTARDVFTPVNGFVIYNTTTNTYQCYQNGAWVDVISSGGGGYGTITSTADWNALLTDGKYLTSGATYVNAPLFDLTTLGVLTVTRTAPTDAYILQEWIEKTTCNTWKRCSKNSGTNWSMWKTVKDFSDTRGVQITIEMSDNVVITNPTADAALIAGLRIDITSGAASIPYALEADVLRNKIQLGTATSASAALYIQQIAYQNSLNFFNKKGGLRFETLVSLPTYVSTAAEDYTVTFGSQLRTTAGMKMLSYNHAENAGNWSSISDNGGAETVTDTGVTPAHGCNVSSAITSFNVLRTEWLKTTDTVNFFIDDVLVATHTTNNGNNFRFDIGFKKNAGTTARNMVVGETTYQFCIEEV